MITYLTQVLNLPLVQASNTLTNFSGTASFTPLIGALIADSVAGRFWTIIVGSIIYELVLTSLYISPAIFIYLDSKIKQSKNRNLLIISLSTNSSYIDAGSD